MAVILNSKNMNKNVAFDNSTILTIKLLEYCKTYPSDILGRSGKFVHRFYKETTLTGTTMIQRMSNYEGGRRFLFAGSDKEFQDRAPHPMPVHTSNNSCQAAWIMIYSILCCIYLNITASTDSVIIE